ncbi:hypothetical protein [Bacillus sp. SG-1]|nr:hypothetical protein [Bacillus sp. SG-1]
MIVFILVIMITLFSIEVSVRKTVKQNEEMIELLKGLQPDSRKE